MKRIAEAGSGVVVILRQQESPRELTESVRWLAATAQSAAQSSSQSAAHAAERSTKTEGEGAVLRTFGVGAQILKDLGVRRMRVLSAPKQMHGISAFDLEIEGYVGVEG
jgi:3,4-dihydroxy 2-butanone 4-phosphate synthase/GTP cyclohydrolase II